MSKILIIDDSGLSRRMLRSILEAAGHAVVEATDGLSGLERFSLEKPDLVLLDLTMGGMHGLEVMDKLKELDPGALIVAATADIQKSTREMVLEKGAKGFVAKPFTAEEVLKTVANALKGDQT